MPLSEFLRMARGKLESGQKKPSPTDFSLRPDDELVELVWENGQIMMQGQSSRVTRSPTLNNLPLSTPKFRDPLTSRIGKFGGVEAILNDISPVVPSGDLDLSQDDEMVPWLSYPMDGALAQDYGSEFLPGISGVTANGMSTQNSVVSVGKRSSCDKTVSNLHSGGSTFKGSSDSSRARPLYSWLPHRQTSDAVGSGISDIISNNTSSYPDAVFGNPGKGRGIVNDSTNTKMERQNIQPPSNLLNFSHFSRPATLVKANLQKSDRIPTSVSSGVEIIEAKEKGLTASGSNPVKSAIFDRFNGAQKDSRIQVSSANVSMVNSRQPLVKTPKEPCPPEKTDNFCRETSIANDKPVNISNNTANSIKGVPDCEKSVEPVAASSSVGSGNSADRVSCEQTPNSKRKFRDTEESECRSDEIETESVGVKKPTPAQGGTGSKRSRAAEVHNLSERRRRDRINEKMRALQELIPNCNKADKASMLDEAIEYLKTLQLQVQIMSMGAGLCMPPMMFPTGMQHMHPAHVPHFPPMGVGMGMGMGYGMGMVDMNGGSPACPIFPVAHFPSPVSGPANFQRIPGPNLSLYGHPGQGLPTSVPRPPLVPLNTQLPVSSALGTSALRNGNRNEVHNASPILNSGDTMTNIKSQLMNNVEAGSSANHRSDQVQVTNEALDQPATMQENKKATDGGAPAALTAATATDISKGPGYD